MRTLVFSIALFVAATAPAQDEPVSPDAGNAGANPAADSAATAAATSAADGVKTMSGMSILGNEEAPKSLVIVPWKSSRLGDGLGISNALDESPRPVDRDVFMRELHFYELRSGSEK